MSAPTDPGSRLERALELYLATPSSGPAEAHQLLSSHPDLRDLLEPMLVGHQQNGHAADEQVLGDFRLVRELGRGGMGIVYEAWQRSLDRRVAVKVLAPSLVASPSAIARFHREAAAAGRLRHPNIVEVLGFGSDNGQHFFAMQLVEGESLFTCKAQFCDPHHAIALAVQVTDALVHAHEQGLVHRDVKPANILVRGDRHALLTDFGIASDEALPSLTREGSFLGTLDYASPEQVRGEPVDARTDVWAVGVILYELLSGKHPFTAATQAATMRNILANEPPPLRHSSAISNDLAAVVGRAIEKHRPRRYGTAAALLADLRALQGGATVSARLPTALERLHRWARREPWRAIAAATLLLGVPTLAGTAGYLWANTPRIEAAVALEAARKRQGILAEATVQLHDDHPAAGLATMALLPHQGDEEASLVRVLMYLAQDRLAEARTELQPYTSETADLARAFLDERTPVVGTNDGHNRDAYACWVRAELLLGQATHRGTRNRALLTRSLEMARLAVALAPAPQLSYLIALAKAAESLDDRPAMTMAERALARHFPDDLTALRVRARTLSRVQPEAALALLPDLPAEDPRTKTLWGIRGIAYEALDRLEQAEDATRKWIDGYPDDGIAWANLGVVLRKQKRYEEAEKALRRSIELAPFSAYIWNNLGLTLRNRGDKAQARQAFAHSLKLRGDYAPAAYNLGNLLTEAGEFAAAADAFRQATEADPDDIKSLANLGDALVRSGRAQQALPVFLTATQKSPNAFIPQFNLAKTALDLGLPELALPAARRARELDKKGANGLRVHAEALLAQTVVDAPAALADAQAAEQRCHGTELSTKLVLARALEASQQPAAAITLLEQAQHDPQFADHSELGTVATALARLRADK